MKRFPRFDVYFFPLVVVLLVATWFRLQGVTALSVSTDEGWSTWAIQPPHFELVIDKLAHDRHPPFYFLILSYWSKLAGDSHLALRLPSILAGVLTTAIVYRMGDDTFGRTAKHGREDVAWYGMLIWAVLPIAVYYSQEIRHYAWFTLWVSLSSLWFIRVLRKPTFSHLLGYTFTLIGMMYTLYFAVWVIGLQVGVGFLLWRGDARVSWRVRWKDRLAVIGAWAVAGVAYLPWLYVMLSVQWQWLQSGISYAPGTFHSTPAEILQLMGQLFGGGLALTVGLYVVGAWGSLVSDRTDNTLGLRLANPAWLAELYVVMGWLVLFPILVLLNTYGTGVLAARTTVFMTPFIAVVVGAGFVRLRQGARWSLLIAYLVVSVGIPPLIQPRLAYEQTAEVLATHINPADLVILETGWDDNAFAYEIRQRLGYDTSVIRTLPWVNDRVEPVLVVSKIGEALQHAERVWVVNWFQPSQLIPHLTHAENGFVPILTTQASVGTDYQGRFAYAGAHDYVLIQGFAQPNLNDVGVSFGTTLTLHEALFSATVQVNQPLYVDAWWSVPRSVALDYSVGVFLLAPNGTVITDYNGAVGATPTSTWQANQLQQARYAIPTHNLARGTYELVMVVYHYETPDQPLMVGELSRLALGLVKVR